MPIQKYIDRIRYIDSLIRCKATGTPKQLAKKLNLSQRQTLEFLKEMKELGCPIKYSRERNSYFYDAEGEVSISFFDKHFAGIKKNNDIRGGKNNYIKKLNCNNTAGNYYNLLLYFLVKVKVQSFGPTEKTYHNRTLANNQNLVTAFGNKSKHKILPRRNYDAPRLSGHDGGYRFFRYW